MKTLDSRSRAILLALGSLAAAAAGPPPEARAIQVRRDAVGALGAVSQGPGGRVRDTAGLPVIGRSTRPDLVLWNGFWFPQAGVVSSAPSLPPAPPDGAVIAAGQLPQRTRFAGIWPNPVRGTATLQFEIAPGTGGSATSPASTRIELYDVSGRLAATLLEGGSTPGYHRLAWDTGRLSNGVYLLRFRSGRHTETRRIVLLQ